MIIFHAKSLTIYCAIVQLKAVDKNTIRKTTCLICDVMLPATGADKTDNLPIGITETLHMPRLIMVFISFDAFILPLGKSGEVEQRSPCLYRSSKCGW